AVMCASAGGRAGWTEYHADALSSHREEWLAASGAVAGGNPFSAGLVRGLEYGGSGLASAGLPASGGRPLARPGCSRRGAGRALAGGGGGRLPGPAELPPGRLPPPPGLAGLVPGALAAQQDLCRAAA